MAVFLRYFADLSYAQIGEVLGIAEGTVAATLSQAHEQLEHALTPEEVVG
jgi:DNA-directed RNA polymerase specialized sigma24 family protein